MGIISLRSSQADVKIQSPVNALPEHDFAKGTDTMAALDGVF